MRTRNFSNRGYTIDELRGKPRRNCVDATRPVAVNKRSDVEELEQQENSTVRRLQRIAKGGGRVWSRQPTTRFFDEEAPVQDHGIRDRQQRKEQDVGNELRN